MSSGYKKSVFAGYCQSLHHSKIDARSKTAKPRGFTGEATIPDIAQIAAKTEVEWNWLETPSGHRRSREQWLSIHETWTQ